MKIELLIFDGCPNHELAEKLVRQSLEELGIVAQIEIINVANDDDAVAKRFLGSPSIRINGKDIEIEEDEQTQYSMSCRVYATDEERSGVPSKDLLLNKLREASV